MATFLTLLVSVGYKWVKDDWRPAGKSEINRLYKYYEKEKGGIFDSILCNFNSYRDIKINKKFSELWKQDIYTGGDIEYLFETIKQDRQWGDASTEILEKIFMYDNSNRVRTRKLDDFLLKNFIDILEVDRQKTKYVASRVLAADGSERAFHALDRALKNCLDTEYISMCFDYSRAISQIGGWRAIDSLLKALNKDDGFINNFIEAARTREQKAWVYRFLIDKYWNATKEQKRYLKTYRKDIDRLRVEGGIYDELPLHIFY